MGSGMGAWTHPGQVATASLGMVDAFGKSDMASGMDGWMVVLFFLRSKCQHSIAWQRRSWEGIEHALLRGVLYEYHSIALTDIVYYGVGGHQSLEETVGDRETERRGTKWVNTGIASGLLRPKIFLTKCCAWCKGDVESRRAQRRVRDSDDGQETRQVGLVPPTWDTCQPSS
jgi:hypothetical protein